MFLDRHDAGRRLAQRLSHYARRNDVVVLALPRGGVPVGYEVARALGVPLDIFLVRKLGVPGHEELAMGAIASGGVQIENPDVMRYLDVPKALVEAVVERERRELVRRELAYRRGTAPLPVAGRVAILVDDGLATGASMRAAVVALRARAPARIVIAVPVGAPETCAALAREADELVCDAMPESFRGVGQWYEDFSQTSDAEVRALLDDAASATDRAS